MGVRLEGAFGDWIELLNRELLGKTVVTRIELQNKPTRIPAGTELEVIRAVNNHVSLWGPACECCGIQPHITEVRGSSLRLTKASHEKLLKERERDKAEKKARKKQREELRAAARKRQSEG